jgi:hypothetical protein
MESAYIKFNGGIWSEVLKGRYDLGNYKSASRTCENFIPTRYGQVEKRSGTKHLGFAKNDGKVCVLHPFQYSVNTKFILEFGDLYIRFWSNDLQVESAPSTPLEVVTPYLEAELYELQMRAVNDVVYIVHPNHPVGKLTRLADDNWTYAVADLSLPFVDPDVNSSEVTLTPSATTGSITITASADAFNSTHVGSELRLQYLEESQSFSVKQDIAISPQNYYPDIFNANDDALYPFNPTLSGTYGADNTSRRTRIVALAVGSKSKYYTSIRDYDLTAWSAGVYAVNDLVTDGGLAYICVGVTTGGDPAPVTDTDNWNPVVNPDDAPAYFTYGAVNMPPQTVSGEWSFKTTGNWVGEYLIQRSVDGGVNWSTIRSLVSADDANYLVEEDEGGESVQIRILSGEHYSGGTEPDVHTFTILSASTYGVATIDSYTSATEVSATVTTDMPKTTASVSWQESAFSDYQGYPRAIALFDNRLMLAGTAKKPQAFFYSGINSYDDFLALTTLADAPFFVEALSDDQSSIQWLSAQRELFVGTASVEGVLMTRKQDEAQSPENLPIVRWNESMGSAHRAALPMRDSLMCLQRGRTTVNMLAYSLERDGYTGEEVSLLCNHLFSSGVQQMAHLREPYTGAYTIQEDGTLCHMVYEPKLEVTAWCKFTTQNGSFESVAVLPSSNSSEDEVWCVVKRLVNGVTKRHVERFTIDNRAKQEASDTDNLWYLDAGVKSTGTNLTTVSGLNHLEGETVCVLADGIKGEYIVNTGSITLTTPADTVIVGLPVTSEFEPLDLEVQGSAGKRKQLYQSKLMMHKSLGGAVAFDGQEYQDIVYHTSGELMDSSIPLKSGYAEVFHESSHARQKYWRIKHDEPHSFTLQAVVQSFTVSKG